MSRLMPVPEGGPFTALKASRWVPARAGARAGARRRPLPPGLLIGAAIFALMVLIAVFGPLFLDDPKQPDIANLLAKPGSDGHLLGTDTLGRDLLSRIVTGMRVSLLVSGLGMLGAMLVGVSAGLLAAFGGRWAETVVMRLVDIQLAFPYVLLAIALTSVLTPSIPVLILLMVLAGWAAFARVVRSSAMQERAKDYVKAAALAGASKPRIARKYVLPSLLPPILVLGAMQMAMMIVFEATLSYLGMGIQPPTPSWGGIMLEGQRYLKDAWWISTLPGVGILLTTVSLNLVADGLQKRFGARLGEA
jgi:peptide/nickel transport system permease protein